MTSFVTASGVILALGTAAITATAAAADNPTYRVAGLVAVSPERTLAMVETSDGEQALYRVGDALGDGQIVAIGNDSLVVQLGGRRVTLMLAGKAVALSAEGAQQQAGGQPAPRTATRMIRPAQAAESLQNPRRGESTDERAERINGVLGLPNGARILSVERQSVATLEAAVDRMLPLLGNNQPIRLTVSGTDAMDEVYLLPEDLLEE